MFIDTHCHIKAHKAQDYINNAKALNVSIMINASEDLESSLQNVTLNEKYSSLYTCVGVHPLNVKDFKKEDFHVFLKLIEKKCVKAIGEIGLDYYYSKENKELQKEVFCMFLDLAQKNDLPVVVHSREATKDTLDILKRYKLKGVIHCFSGSLETAKEYMDLGFCIGVGGVLTFKNSKLFEVIKDVPLSYIVLETDAPFLTPEPYRKFENESKFIPVIAQSLANYKGIDIEEVEKITTLNAKRIFDIEN